MNRVCFIEMPRFSFFPQNPTKCPFCQKTRRNGDNKCKEGNCGNMARPYGSDSEGEDDITMSYDSDE